MVIGWTTPTQSDDGLPPIRSVDCGTLALDHLLRLEGRPISLDRLEAALGPLTPAAGPSFRELRAAARRVGLRLDAVVLPKKQSAINGPALLFVKSGREGHFIVVRPVGHTGRLLQIIDGESSPEVADADRLFDAPGWTGLALIPHRPNYLGLGAGSISAICVVGFLFRRWSRTPGRSVQRQYEVSTADRS